MAATTITRTGGTPADTASRAVAASAESLLVTGDDRLAETVLSLAAATGHRLRRVRHPADAESRWQRAPLVIVGADSADDCFTYGLPERRGLILCTTLAWFGADPADTSMVWPMAIRLHADHVITVPEATDWLLDRFTRTARDTTPAPVVAAVAGHGGAGASTLALAAATAAAREGQRTVLIDLDMKGGGIDAAAGLASSPGWRWPALATGAGQLEPERLLAGLARRDGLHVLAPDPRQSAEVDADALERVLHAARIGADLVVVDLPRARTAAAARAAAAARSVAVVLGPSPRSWEAARSVIGDYSPRAARLGMVLRGRTAPRPAATHAEPDPRDELELPVWGTLPTDDRLPIRLRQGRRPRGRTARELDGLMTKLGRLRLTTDSPAADRAGASR